MIKLFFNPQYNKCISAWSVQAGHARKMVSLLFFVLPTNCDRVLFMLYSYHMGVLFVQTSGDHVLGSLTRHTKTLVLPVDNNVVIYVAKYCIAGNTYVMHSYHLMALWIFGLLIIPFLIHSTCIYSLCIVYICIFAYIGTREGFVLLILGSNILQYYPPMTQGPSLSCVY